MPIHLPSLDLFHRQGWTPSLLMMATRPDPLPPSDGDEAGSLPSSLKYRYVGYSDLDPVSVIKIGSRSEYPDSNSNPTH